MEELVKIQKEIERLKREGNITIQRGTKVGGKKPPKLVLQYAESMAKFLGITVEEALESEPVKKFWKKLTE